MCSVASRATSIRNVDYCASKFAMRGYITGLRQELLEENSPVALTNIYPSIVNTGMFGGFMSKL